MRHMYMTVGGETRTYAHDQGQETNTNTTVGGETPTYWRKRETDTFKIVGGETETNIKKDRKQNEHI